MPVMSTPSFRFLDLPAELRCMVYEAIEVTTRKEVLDVSRTYDTLEDDASITMFRGALERSILATSHLVNKEASPIMARKIQMMANEPLRFLVSWHVAWITRDRLRTCFNILTGEKDASQYPTSDEAKFVRSCSAYCLMAGNQSMHKTHAFNVEFTITNTAREFMYRRRNLITSICRMGNDSGMCFKAFCQAVFPDRACILVSRPEPHGTALRNLTEAEWSEHMKELEDL
jgi:hypothetical protein